MGKEPKPFRFKRFSVWHHRSALKVGVDGVLVGAWADVSGASRILDVGTGCGMIALMMAQRTSAAEIIGIDCDPESVEEAILNAAESPWSDRVRIEEADFTEFASSMETGHFDLIVSNPPFFDSGVKEADTARLKARHQGGLSPSAILIKGRNILKSGGIIVMIVPAESSETLKEEAHDLGYALKRECLVRGHANAPFKRTLLEWRYVSDSEKTCIPEMSTLTLEEPPGSPTEEYRSLCKDFYLKF